MADDDRSAWTDADLEIAVAGARWATEPTNSGRAAAEIAKRRRAYEDERDDRRRKHESALFDAAGDRDVQRKRFEEALAERQMAHATALAAEQDTTAKRVARATVFAAIAAGCSALGALVAALLEVVRYLGGK